jgi:preprotein translocase subunit SecD
LGIYETVSLKELMPLTEFQSKTILKQDLDLNKSVMAYISINDREHIRTLIEDLSSENSHLLPTRSTGSDRNSLAIISVHKEPYLAMQDIRKAVVHEKGIELRFNREGTKKWHKMTKKNTGKMIAFVINDEIWSIPVVNAPIKVGVALITGIDDRATIEKTCEQINSYIR